MSELVEFENQEVFNLIEFVTKCATKKMSWAEVKEAYNIKLNYHHFLLKQQAMQTADIHLNQGLLYDVAQNNSFMALEALEPSFVDNSPLIDAINNDNARLFEIIMYYYGREVLQEKDILKKAALAEGNYLNKIIEMYPKAAFPADEVFKAFEAVCQNNSQKSSSRVEALLNLFPNPKKYRTPEGKNLLMVAVEAQNEEVSALLTEKGFNPLQYTDSHCTKTIYGYCYEKLLRSAQNQRLKRIVDALRKGIQSRDATLKNWIEEKAFRSFQNQLADRRKMIVFTATATLIALFGLHTCHNKDNANTEKANQSIMPQVGLIVKKNTPMLSRQNQLIR